MNTRLPGNIGLLIIFLFFAVSLTVPVNVWAAPVLTNVTPTNITSTTVTVTWTTDTASDSSVGYDTDPSYNTEVRINDYEASTTSHSVSVTGLTPDTSYYFYAESNDGTGAASIEGTFTTSSAAAATAAPTPTPIIIVVTAAPTTAATATATPTPTPTPTPFVDRVAPNVEITTEMEDNYAQAPQLEGTATDSIGVVKIEYSLDDGFNWLPVDATKDLETLSATFLFTPNIYEDGNYKILARAFDEEGNIGKSSEITLIIDRLPPRVGGNLVSLGPLPLYPNRDGTIITIPGLEQKITMSAVGGATSIELFTNQSESSLGFNPQTGLWSGILNLNQPGRYKLSTKATDGAGNVTERDLNDILVINPGTVYDIGGEQRIDKGKISLYVKNPTTRLWNLWDARSFRQENPQNLIEGQYSFFIPPGTYYLTITGTGRSRLTSKIFKVDETMPLVSDFELLKRKTFSIGPIKIPLPDLFSEKADVVFKNYENKQTEDPLVGKQAPNFLLPGTSQGLRLGELKGRASIISFVNTWSPPAIEQLPILESYYDQRQISHAIIASEESISRASIFLRRGSYSFEMLVDADGELVEDYNITSLPKHLILDRTGTVRDVVYGVLNAQQLDDLIDDI